MHKVLALGVFVVALWLAPGALAAGWCGGGDEVGTDRPDIVTAQQVHAVVAIPSDAADPFATDAGRLADDVTSMLTWWQGQDPTRIPRFDQATFPGGNCLDITFVRLPQTGAAYTALAANGAFSSIAGTLALAVFTRLLGLPLPVTLAALTSSALVIWKHRGNISRIANGTENNHRPDERVSVADLGIEVRAYKRIVKEGTR